MTTLANIAAEEALVGSILINPDGWHEVNYIQPEDFSRISHQWIWSAIAKLRSEKKDVDALTVSNAAGNGVTFDEVFRLTAVPQNSYNAPTYAQTVADFATRRRVLQELSSIAKEAQNTDKPALEVVEGFRRRADLLGKTVQGGKVRTMKELVQDYDDALSGKTTPVRQFSFRSRELNRIFGGGLFAPRVSVIGGKPGMGKTLLLQRISAELGMNGHASFMVSQEMEDWDLVVRGLSAEGEIPEEDLQVLKLEEHFDKYHKAMEKLAGMPIWVSDESSWQMSALRSQMYRLQQDCGVNVMLVDYLGLLADHPDKESEHEQLTWKTQELKRMAKELGIAILVLHTVNATGDQSGGTGPAYKVDLAMTLLSDADFQNKFMPLGDRRQPLDNVRWLMRVKTRYGKWQPPAEFKIDPDYPIIRDMLTTVAERGQ